MKKKRVKEGGKHEDANPCDSQEEEDDCPANQDQCPGRLIKVLLFITPIIVLVNIHFAFVLYTHDKKDGGLVGAVKV